MELQELEECFKQHEHPFVGLETNYQQIQYHRSNFNLVVSIYCYLMSIIVMTLWIFRNPSELYLVVDMFGRELVLSDNVYQKKTASCMCPLQLLLKNEAVISEVGKHMHNIFVTCIYDHIDWVWAHNLVYSSLWLLWWRKFCSSPSFFCTQKCLTNIPVLRRSGVM